MAQMKTERRPMRCHIKNTDVQLLVELRGNVELGKNAALWSDDEGRNKCLNSEGCSEDCKWAPGSRNSKRDGMKPETLKVSE